MTNAPAKIPMAGMPSKGMARRNALRACGALPAVVSRQRLHPWAKEAAGVKSAAARNAIGKSWAFNARTSLKERQQ
jgi:hypothetical protein